MIPALPNTAGHTGAGAARWQAPEPLAAVETRLADGASIVLRRHGNPDGPRLVVSHGNGLAADSYYPFWSLLADRFDLIVYDFRNHGWNPVGERRAHNIPTFVADNDAVVRAIDAHFGVKPKTGVFHSMSALTAFLQVQKTGGFSALVLFDLPICPPGGTVADLVAIGRRIAVAARMRPDRFDSLKDFADGLRRSPYYERVLPGVPELLARTLLRPADGGNGYELRCPPAYEAQIHEYVFGWADYLDLANLPCLVKTIGSDPTLPNSYMPSMDLSTLTSLDHDFLPETTHFLQMENPEECAALVVAFLEKHGLA